MQSPHSPRVIDISASVCVVECPQCHNGRPSHRHRHTHARSDHGGAARREPPRRPSQLRCGEPLDEPEPRTGRVTTMASSRDCRVPTGPPRRTSRPSEVVGRVRSGGGE